MVRNLLRYSHPVLIHDTDATNLRDFHGEEGVSVAHGAAEVAQGAPIVMSMLPNDAVLKDVTGQMLPHLEGKLHISCSTVSPATSRELARLHASAGAEFVAAPVFARPDGVAARKASIMVSGPRPAVHRAKDLLATTAPDIFDFGEDVGAANVVKLCGNFLIAASIESIAEAAALAESEGLDRLAVVQTLNQTLFDCLIYRGYGQRVSERDHKPGGFPAELGLKDVSLVQQAARGAGVPMPFLSTLVDRFVSAKAKGRAGMDWSAIGLAAAEDAGLDVTADLARLKREMSDDEDGWAPSR